jgi:hypothetical protein
MELDKLPEELRWYVIGLINNLIVCGPESGEWVRSYYLSHAQREALRARLEREFPWWIRRVEDSPFPGDG